MFNVDPEGPRMSVVEETEAPPVKASKLPLLIGLVLALAAGAGGFYVTFSGMIGGSPEASEVSEKEMAPGVLPDISFVELEPLVVSLNNQGRMSHLRFRGHLEVRAGQEAAVENLMPRVMDVLNSYLRALDFEEIERTSALIKLLRRIHLVVGEGRVRDLLVTEFVLN
jgi:flagellar FliL protein